MYIYIIYSVGLPWVTAYTNTSLTCVHIFIVFHAKGSPRGGMEGDKFGNKMTAMPKAFHALANTNWDKVSIQFNKLRLNIYIITIFCIV